MNKYLEEVYKFTLPIQFKTIKNITILTMFGGFLFALLNSVDNNRIIFRELRGETGELAWALLIFTVFISLLSKIFPKFRLLKQFLPLRKYTGIFIFFITLAHVLAHLLKLNVLGNINDVYFEIFQKNWAITIGTIAFVIMIPLFITSTNFAIRRMGYNRWKLLHKLNHIIFILTALHIGFVEFSREKEIEFDAILILMIYIAGYSWLSIKRRRET